MSDTIAAGKVTARPGLASSLIGRLTTDKDSGAAQRGLNDTDISAGSIRGARPREVKLQNKLIASCLKVVQKSE